MSEHIVKVEGNNIALFDVSFTGEIIITNKQYSEILQKACYTCKCSAVDLSASNITKINYGAFIDAFNLKRIIFPSSLIELADNVFGQSGLTSVYIGPNIRRLSGNTFNRCQDLKIIKVDPENEFYCSVNNYLFNKNKDMLMHTPCDFDYNEIPEKDNIKSVDTTFCSGLPIHSFVAWENLESLSKHAFHMNNELRFVDLSSTKIQIIPMYCFDVVAKIQEIRLPYNLTTLSVASFLQCNRLQSLVIPQKVDSISNEAFNTLPNLIQITYFGTNLFERNNIFRLCPKLKTVRVTRFYESNLFGSISVSFDANEYGGVILTNCPTFFQSRSMFSMNTLVYVFILI